MKKYEKPEIKAIEISDADIIQTSLTIGNGNYEGGDFGFMSLKAQSDATGDVFQK